MLSDLCAVLAAAALIALAGASLVGPALGALRPLFGRLGAAALAWFLGGALLASSMLALGLAGLPIRPWSLALLLLGAFAAGRLVHRLAGLQRLPAPLVPARSRAHLFARLVLVASAALFLARVEVMPLWSWDHHAIWGIKARRMAAEGRLDLAFLATPELKDSRPDYPLGYPAACLLHSWGRPPSPLAFKAVHALFGLALLALLAAALRAAGCPATLALALTAWAGAMPLFWDTEAVGQAEMPLALASVGAAALILLARHHGALWPWAGVALGFLPWVKQEGWPLAVALALAALWLTPAGKHWRLKALALGAFPLLLGERLVAWFLLPPGVSFFSGDPFARLGERLPEAGTLLLAMARHLAARETLGLWFGFALAATVLLRRRDRLGIALVAVVAVQLGLYLAITFGVYLPPLDHIRASFPRITAALAPLAILALGRAFAARMEA